MWVTIRPPSTGPSAGANMVGIIMSVDARARSAGGKARNSIAMPTGVSIPPPTPCSTRKRSVARSTGPRRTAPSRHEDGEGAEERVFGCRSDRRASRSRDPHRQAERVAEHDPLHRVGVGSRGPASVGPRSRWRCRGRRGRPTRRLRRRSTCTPPLGPTTGRAEAGRQWRSPGRSYWQPEQYLHPASTTGRASLLMGAPTHW